MPVDFFTSEQESKYGCFCDTPTSEQLAKYFWLDDTDKELIWNRRGEHNQLGFAVQLGTFLSDPIDVPQSVITYMANQLYLDAQSFSHYQNKRSQWDQMREIRSVYGYKNFTDHPAHWRFIRWLYARAWLYNERSSVLFDLAIARCIEQKILLPGVSVLTRLVSTVRDRVAENWDVSRILSKRLQQFARHPVAVRSQAIARMPYQRRIAMLVAFAKIYTQSAQDDVIDVLDRYLTDLFAKTYRKEQKERLRTIKDLDKAARQLREHTDPSVHPKTAVFEKVSEKDLIQAVQTVDSLTYSPNQTLAYSGLLQYYGTIRKFLPLLMEEFELQATPAGLPILQAWNFVKEHGKSMEKCSSCGFECELV